MKSLFTNESHLLQSGQLIAGTARQAQTLRVLHGRVWVTISGMTEDFWLEKGATLNLPAAALVVVEAGDHASIVETMANPVLQSGKPSAWARFWHGFFPNPVAA